MHFLCIIGNENMKISKKKNRNGIDLLKTNLLLKKVKKETLIDVLEKK